MYLFALMVVVELPELAINAIEGHQCYDLLAVLDIGRLVLSRAERGSLCMPSTAWWLASISAFTIALGILAKHLVPSLRIVMGGACAAFVVGVRHRRQRIAETHSPSPPGFASASVTRCAGSRDTMPCCGESGDSSIATSSSGPSSPCFAAVRGRRIAQHPVMARDQLGSFGSALTRSANWRIVRAMWIGGVAQAIEVKKRRKLLPCWQLCSLIWSSGKAGKNSS